MLKKTKRDWNSMLTKKERLKLNALAHTLFSPAHIHVDIHIIYCHRNGLLRFVKWPVWREKSWSGVRTQSDADHNWISTDFFRDFISPLIVIIIVIDWQQQQPATPNESTWKLPLVLFFHQSNPVCRLPASESDRQRVGQSGYAPWQNS